MQGLNLRPRRSLHERSINTNGPCPPTPLDRAANGQFNLSWAPSPRVGSGVEVRSSHLLFRKLRIGIPCFCCPVRLDKIGNRVYRDARTPYAGFATHDLWFAADDCLGFQESAETVVGLFAIFATSHYECRPPDLCQLCAAKWELHRSYNEQGAVNCAVILCNCSCYVCANLGIDRSAYIVVGSL